MNYLRLVITALFLLLTSGCSLNESFDYTSFNAHKPKSILVLYPTDQTNDITSAYKVLASTALPLANAGYYVFPVSMVNDTFRYNGLTEGAEIQAVPLANLKEVFDADAVLYLDVFEFGSKYIVIDSVFTVGVHAKLVDMSTGELLWERHMVANNMETSNDILARLIISVFKQIENNVSEEVGFNIARFNSSMLYAPNTVAFYLGKQEKPILYGPYSVKYGTDKFNKTKQNQELNK